MGLFVHVTNHTAQSRSIVLNSSDREDLIAEVFLTLVENDFAALRHFRGTSSLATYLSVIARRVIVRHLLKKQNSSPIRSNKTSSNNSVSGEAHLSNLRSEQPALEQRLENAEEVEQMLSGLKESEASILRLFHLEGKTYAEISIVTGMAENSIGPILNRARIKLRERASIE